MILWGTTKIKNDSSEVGLTTSGNALCVSRINIDTAAQLPATTTFAGTLQSITVSAATFTTATISTADITTALTVSGQTTLHDLNATAATFTGLLSAASISVSGQTTLPTNTTIGGNSIYTLPVVPSFLYIDGHFGLGDDYVNVTNGSGQSVYIAYQLRYNGEEAKEFLDDDTLSHSLAQKVDSNVLYQFPSFRVKGGSAEDTFNEHGQVRFIYSKNSWSGGDDYYNNPASHGLYHVDINVKDIRRDGGLIQTIQGFKPLKNIILFAKDANSAWGFYSLSDTDIDPQNKDVDLLIGVGKSLGMTHMITDRMEWGGAGTRKWHYDALDGIVSTDSRRGDFYDNTRCGIVRYIKSN